MMATKKTGVLVGIAAIAVIGVAAVLYFSQWPPAHEDATGAIGAAERYRAEQITDEDVILDIPGQAQLAEAVFDVLTDEQKADLIGRVGQAERAGYYARFDEPDAFARLSPTQQGRFVLAMDAAAQERVAAALKFNAADLARMSPDALARGLTNMDAEARARAVGRFDADTAFARMNPNQQAHFVLAMDAAAQERIAAALHFKAADLARMSPDALARGLTNMDAEARARAVGRFDADTAFARMNPNQQAHFVLAMDAAAHERFAGALKFKSSDLARINTVVLGRAFSNLNAEARAKAIGRFDAETAFARMNPNQQAHFVLAMDAAAHERFAGALKMKSADLARMSPDALARGLTNMDAEARARAVGRFDADTAFARMNPNQQAHFVLAMDAAAQERIAAAVKFTAADLARMSPDALARGLTNMDAEARARAVGRFDADTAFARMNPNQQAHFVLAMDAAAHERFAGALKFKSADLARMSPNALARGLTNMDAEARARAVGRFDADTAFARMNPSQQAHFVLAMDAAAHERFAGALKFKSADLARMSPNALARGLENIDAEARARAIGRFEVNEATFEAMTTLQRAAFADALGSQAFERIVLRSREFNRLSQGQQLAVWGDLSRQGQVTALRYSGFSADVARASSLQRDQEFERYMQQRFAQ
jgi:methionine aminopeptidase